MNTRRSVALLLLLVFASSNLHAASFCVTTSTELQNALTSAATNAEDDTIQVQIGTYTPPVQQGFIYGSTDTHALSIVGGYGSFMGSAPCSIQVMNPELTRIDGGGTSRLFSFRPLGGAGDLSLTGLSFVNGHSLASYGPPLAGDIADYSGTVRLERIVVRNNVSDDMPVVWFHTRGAIVVRNSVFVDNTMYYDNGVNWNNGAIQFESRVVSGTAGGLTLNNNTVANNRNPLGYAHLSLYIQNGPIFLANNVMHGNGAVDADTLVFMEYSCWGTWLNNSLGYWLVVPISDHEMHCPNTVQELPPADPRFIGNGDYRLADDSPLIESGANIPTGGIGDWDAAGKPRRIGTVDVGAYEHRGILFRDGFE